MVKWDEKTVAKFKSLDKQGLSRDVIAERMGISVMSVSVRRYLLRHSSTRRSTNKWTDANLDILFDMHQRGCTKEEIGKRFNLKPSCVAVTISKYKAIRYGQK